MCLTNNTYYIELHVEDLNHWVKFYTTSMGFRLVKAKGRAALLSDGHTLLEICKNDPEVGEEKDSTSSTFCCLN